MKVLVTSGAGGFPTFCMNADKAAAQQNFHVTGDLDTIMVYACFCQSGIPEGNSI